MSPCMFVNISQLPPILRATMRRQLGEMQINPAKNKGIREEKKSMREQQETIENTSEVRSKGT